MPRKMYIYVIFAIERNIFAVTKKYKYNSSSKDTMIIISVTPEHGLLCKNTHLPHSDLCVGGWGTRGEAGLGGQKGLEQPPNQLSLSSLYS